MRQLPSPKNQETLLICIDLLAAMDAWVERGTAPDQLVATQSAADGTTAIARRPVREFPKFPRYNGTGDPNKAESFTCSATRGRSSSRSVRETPPDTART